MNKRNKTIREKIELNVICNSVKNKLRTYKKVQIQKMI